MKFSLLTIATLLFLAANLDASVCPGKEKKAEFCPGKDKAIEFCPGKDK
jgi:hypothetical protein